MKNTIKIFSLIIIIIVIVTGIIIYRNNNQTKVETVKNIEKVPKVNLTIDAFGIIKATAISNIWVDFPATVAKVWIREGQHVKQGDPLLTLDISDYLTEIKNQEIVLETEKKNYKIRQSFKNSDSDPDLKQLYVELRTAEKFYHQDLEQLLNREALLKAGAISKNDYDEFKKIVDNRRQTVENLRLNIESLRFSKNIETDRSSDSVKVKDSNINIMKNKLSKSYLKYNKVVSNIENGIVYDLNCVVGDKLGIGDRLEKTLSLLDLDSLIVVADVEEEFINEIQLGTPVSVRLLSDKSHSYQGTIIRIANRAIVKNNVTYIPVEINLTNIDQNIRPEMNVDVKITRIPK